MTRRFLLLLAAFAAGLAATSPPRAARGDAYEERVKPGHCPCAEGQACWHYLRSPMRPPADKCRCGCCLAGGTCEARDRPKGTSGVCWGSAREECFWKRHAYSWKIQCSECWKDESCDACDALIGGRDAKVREVLERQIALETRGNKGTLVVAVSPHFYVVTDLERQVKVPTEGGAPRVASAHEIAHLYAQRCEIAYSDFDHWFGGRIQLGKPMAVYLVAKNQRKEQVASSYFGNPRTNMLYGGGSDRVGGGFSGNGFVGSLQDQRDDLGLHAYCRHMIGHILFSCWVSVSPHERECPIWAFSGAAHFLQKLLPEHADEATYCSNEVAAPSGSPKDWDKKARAMAARNLDPIETFFGRDSLGRFSYDDRVRAWSIMDLCLREDNERWLKALTAIRHSAEENAAFKEGMSLSADDFQRRWVDRLTGKRDTMGEIRKDASEDPDEPGNRERRRIRETQEPDVLSGLIRGLERVDDPRTAAAVVARLDTTSDLVRETIYLVLKASNTAPVRAYLREQGLSAPDPMVRAGVARALGAMPDAEARARIEELLQDRHWLVRANAAQALQRIGDRASLPALVKALDESRPKPWIALADAVASFGERSKEATLLTAPLLSASDWQVRVTACRALAKYGTEDCLDALIDRYETEGGRLQRELLVALKAVARDDLGENADTWRTWWTAQKKQHGGLPPDAPPSTNPADERYAKPKPPKPDEPYYYGRRIFSKSVGFVLDVSGSMETTIRVPKEAAAKLGNIPSEGSRATIAKSAIVDAFKKLDPRVRFQLVFFSTDVRPWKDALTPASPGNVEAAVGAVTNAPLKGETNIHGALKAILGLHEKPTLDATLDPIPDTVYFLTDGAPTRGEITSTPELLSWFEDLNRFAKVDLHVIALGNLGVDLPFLQRLAAIGGGEFIHVPEGR
jgi:HEAT repeat protein